MFYVQSTKHDISFKQALPSQYLTKLEWFAVISFLSSKKLFKCLKEKKKLLLCICTRNALRTFWNAK